MSSPPESQSSGLVDTLLDIQLLVYLIATSIIAILVDVLLLDLFGIQTITDAISIFLIMTVGGYIGMHLIDVAWDSISSN